MTYHNDPENRNRMRRDSSSSMWIGGIVALLVVAGLVFYSMSDNQNVATTDKTTTAPADNTAATAPANRPASPPAGTTGSAPAR